MSNENNIDYDAERMCPVLNKKINSDFCYDYIMALHRFIKLSGVPELAEILERENRVEEARQICRDCPYSDLS